VIGELQKAAEHKGAAPSRVVSLLPAATEIVCALGLREWLVGRSHECDYPPAVRALPACTHAKFDPAAGSAAIDREVKARRRAGLALYGLDIEVLRALRPQVILTQAQCEVCAVSEAELNGALVDWPGAPPRVVSISPTNLAQTWEAIRQVAQAMGVADGGGALLQRLDARVAAVRNKTRALNQRPTVGCLEWLDPLMAAGNWVPELVAAAGGCDVLGVAGQHSAWLDWEALRDADPEVLVLMPCGFDLARTRAEATALKRQPHWPKLRAVRRGQVFVTDGHQFFNRPGPRLVESLEILAELLQPRLFDSGRRGLTWERLSPAV
jgi:iron complex transport system substrate-binding protein